MAAYEDAILAPRLECSLCFELMTEPKQLWCTHTYCKDCLTRLHQCQMRKDTLSCPLCRQVTVLRYNDVSLLQTNFPIKGMVAALQGARRFCCQTRGQYPSTPCTEDNGRCRKYADHEVASMDDIQKKKVKVKSFCHIHLHEEKLWMCTSCNMYICLKCRMLEHHTHPTT